VQRTNNFYLKNHADNESVCLIIPFILGQVRIGIDLVLLNLL
jgi:hypothetical protein